MNAQKIVFVVMTSLVIIMVAVYIGYDDNTGNQTFHSIIPQRANDTTTFNSYTKVNNDTVMTDRTDVTQLYQQARELLAFGEYAGSQTLLEQVIEREPDNSEAHNDLGVVYARQRLYTQAIHEYETALLHNPEYVEACYNLGGTYNALGRTAEAIAKFNETLELDDTFYRAHNNLGGIYALSGEFDTALTYFEKAIDINPDYIDAHRNLANIYEHIGNVARAARHSSIAESLSMKYKNTAQ